ncbi:hypothetical protein M513_13835, partial [Trichuris suis]
MMRARYYYRSEYGLFWQRSRVPTENSSPPVLAEIIMAHFRKRALSVKDASITPCYFKWFLDNIFAFIGVSKKELSVLEFYYFERHREKQKSEYARSAVTASKQGTL